MRLRARLTGEVFSVLPAAEDLAGTVRIAATEKDACAAFGSMQNRRLVVFIIFPQGGYAGYDLEKLIICPESVW